MIYKFIYLFYANSYNSKGKKRTYRKDFMIKASNSRVIYHIIIVICPIIKVF